MKLDKRTLMGLVKRAYSNAGKEDEIRDKLAYRDITFSWNVEDIGFWFTVEVKEGKVFVREGEAKEPDITFYNKKALEFHKGNAEEITTRDMLDNGSFRWTGNMKYLRHVSLLCKCMRTHYKRSI